MAPELRDSAEQQDSARFIALLDLAAPLVIRDPELSVDETLTLLGAFRSLADRLDDPEPGIEAESWLFVFAETALGARHPVTVAARARLAMALAEMGRLDEAAEVAASGPTSADGRSILNALLATRLMEEGRHGEAIPLLEADLARDKALLGADNPELGLSIRLLAEAHIGVGDAAHAVTLLRPVYAWSRAGFYTAEMRAFIALTFGQALSAATLFDEAIPVLDAAHAATENALGAAHRTSLMLGLARANAYGEAGRIHSYDALMQRHFALAERADLSSVERAVTLEAHAERLMLDRRHRAALPVLRDLVKLSARDAGIDPLTGIRALRALGRASLLVDPLGDGRDHLVRAAAQSDALLGPDHVETLRAQADLINFRSDTADLAPSDAATVRRLLAEFRAGAVGRQGEDHAALRRFNAAADAQRAVPPTDAEIDLLRKLAAAEAAATGVISAEALPSRSNLIRARIEVGDFAGALQETEFYFRERSAGATNEIGLLTDGTFLDHRAQALLGLGRVREALDTMSRAVDAALTTRRWYFAQTRGGPAVDLDLWGTVGWRFADAAWHAAGDLSGEAAAVLSARAFETVQIAAFGPTEQAFAAAHIRRAQETPEAAAALAAWEAAMRAADLARIRRATDPASPAPLGFDAAETALAAAVPGLFDQFAADPMPWAGHDGRAVRDLVGPDEALVLIVPEPFALGAQEARGGFVFVATRERLAWARLALSRRDLTVAIRLLHDELDGRSGQAAPFTARAPVDPGRPALGVRGPLFDTDLSHSLYAALFGDPAVAGLLETKAHWILVPQSIAMNLPYAALVTEPTDAAPATGADLRAVSWLGLEKALTVLPSITALRERVDMPAAETRVPGDGLAYIGFGDPAFSGAVTAELRSAGEILAEGLNRARAVRRLPRLPGTNREVRYLASIFERSGSAAYLGAEASEAKLDALVQSRRLDRVGILHFATHGLLAGDLDGLSEPALALTPPASDQVSTGPEGSDDGLLTASEIARLRFGADWVILSACDTSGSANWRAGLDGLNGLVGAFLMAGARALLVSHWRVEDEVAVRLSTLSVDAVAAGAGRADALRAAMRSVARDPSRDASALPLSHPTVWAPFFLVGF
ncbi:MAG: CHAT domain-containing tetratricopeptide repeat protein [Pseudomonadota bacterium]